MSNSPQISYEVEQILGSGNAQAIRSAGAELLGQGRAHEALACFRVLSEMPGADIESRFIYAHLVDDGSHKKRAEARDILLTLLNEFPQVFDHSSDGNLTLIRSAAERCRDLGPFDKAIELFRKLAPLSNEARDYFSLSEILTQGNHLAESVAALETSMKLDPATYDTPANRETVKLGKAATEGPETKLNVHEKKKIGRYPKTQDFLGDFQNLVQNHIAFDLRNEEKFLQNTTRFFTMGSCFARNISSSLNKSGYVSQHMEISEYINTTFANRAFVDWMSGASTESAVTDRIKELLPAGWSAQNTIDIISNSDVFILTLGVAPAFFDRATGEFVLPRPSALNSRVLAEKYEFRTTSVGENVDNVLYLINFIRRLSPNIKIVVTVSPVPLLASFEFESCVAADCLSKSTMRLVAHEIVNNSKLENILYWPSFEIFRWGGSNASNFYAADDGAAWHVSEDKVNGTIKAFIDMFSG